MANQITSYDRMHFSLFVASVIHATIIFGIGFIAPPPSKKAPSLEVTLAVHSTEKAPDKADFLAQANQEGSGSLDEKALLSTTEIADFRDNQIKNIQSEKPMPKQQEKAAQNEKLTTIAQSQYKALNSQLEKQQKQQQVVTESSKALLAQSLEIASLEAQLREKRQAYAKRPRKKTLTALSTKSAVDAAYLDAWRRKIEQIGNAQYKSLGVGTLTGNLRMLVAVNANGTIHEVRILESSGQRSLDNAALRVVRLAAPFDPFPAAIRNTTDILEIIRTWRFEKGSYLTSNQ